MGKTVYSLVLADDVVAMVDSLAAREGYSRSAMVNHILAEYVSLTTPEKANRLMLEAMRELAADCGLRTSAATASSLTLKTALPYKYNPALSYSVELWPGGERLGRLRVSLRSQSPALLDEVGHFFALWSALEAGHLPAPPLEDDVNIEPQRYSRTLRRPAADSNDATGHSLAQYVNLMDNCFKIYFKYLDDIPTARHEAEARYLQGMKSLEGITEL